MGTQNSAVSAPNFNWSIVGSGGYAVTIYLPAIMLNAALIERLGNPKRLAVGYDAANGALAFRAYGGENDIKPVALSAGEAGWRRVYCRAFIRTLAADTGVDFSPSKRYVPIYNADEDAFIVKIAEFTKDNGRGGRGRRRKANEA